MQFKALQDEVIGLRFNEGNHASVKSWLNLRYTAIWNMADWHFKHVRGANLTITANDSTPTMPVDFARCEGLYDAQGYELAWVPPHEYDQVKLGSSSTSNPDIYTVVDREINLYPTPSSSATFTLSYQRRVSHVDGSSGLAAAGIMVNDSDSPIWGGEFDYLLVIDATILGCQALEYPVADLPKQRAELLDALQADSLHSRQAEGVEIWGGV